MHNESGQADLRGYTSNEPNTVARRPLTTAFAVTCTAGAVIWTLAASVTLASGAELAQLASTKMPGAEIVAHCQISEGIFAVATRDSSRGGSYYILSASTSPAELGSFDGEPELQCVSIKSAKELDHAIRTSETIHGQISPSFEGTVVCGFVSATEARCWQLNKDQIGQQVGGWIT